MSNVVLITGASQGIGYGIAEKFHSKGWEVLTLSRKPLTGDESWKPAADSHFVFDLEDVEHIDDVIAEIKHKLAGRPLNALINNAGISPKLANGDRIGVNSADLEFWQMIFNVNVFAPAQLTRGLYENLKAAPGAVVNITSIVVQRVHPFAGSPYAASKAALGGLTREMAVEYAKDNVRVNAISPGEIDTSILSAKTQEVVDTAVPMHRLGTPAEIADSAYFLCSEESSYITGTEILVNGGQHL
jgi:NAD(P)-dependent dehydrogenase (short-subunit alcohol dehydrogenase family)